MEVKADIGHCLNIKTNTINDDNIWKRIRQSISVCIPKHNVAS